MPLNLRTADLLTNAAKQTLSAYLWHLLLVHADIFAGVCGEAMNSV